MPFATCDFISDCLAFDRGGYIGQDALFARLAFVLDVSNVESFGLRLLG